VFKKNAYKAKKIIKKGGEKTSYILSQFVTLAILPKNRLSTEATCLLARITKVIRNAYALLIIYSPLKGLY
jgi:hypothetical protein